MSGSKDFDPASVSIRPAATVMLVRQVNGPLEVFMMRRTTKAAFAGGMYVFPGGAVDEGDSVGDVWSMNTAFAMASIRECFEEAGVLLACDRSGCTVRFDDAEVAKRFTGYRQLVHAGERTLTSVLEVEGLTPRLDDLSWVAHWVTPFGEVRRFDTRFYVAAMPADQDPLHDDIETVDSLWVEPSVALDRAASGELLMLPPGKEFGLTPYGTETMHLLRAEKGYIIIGQDTDGSITPIDLGLNWMIGKTKTDFLGKRSLTRSDTVRPDRKQLVGILPLNKEDSLEEGQHILLNESLQTPVPMLGHITSSYHSPIMGHTFGLAVIKDGRSLIGTKAFASSSNQKTIPVEIVKAIVYDEKNERLVS